MTDDHATTPESAGGLTPLLAGLSRLLAEQGRSLDETFDRVLALGRQRLGMEVGVVAEVEDTSYHVRSLGAATGESSGAALRVGQTLALSETFCEKTLEAGETFTIRHAAHTPWADHPCYRAFAYESYIGTPLRVDGRVWGTLSFASRAAMGRGFDAQAREGVELLAGVLSGELERDQMKAQVQAAVQEAQQARRETQIVLDRLPAMVCRKDREGNILQINRAAAEVADCMPAQMVGRPVADFFPEQAVRSKQQDDRVLETGQPLLGVVESWPAPAGRARYVQTDRIPTRNMRGQIDGVLVVSTDITHLKEAEDELRALNVRFGAFMRNSPAMQWAVDTEGRYIFVNATFEQVMGVKAWDCVGKRPEQVLEAPTGKAFEQIVRPGELIESGDGGAQTVHVDLPIQGRLVPLMVTRFSYANAQGEISIGGSAVDLSEVAQAQRELANLNKDLKALLYVISHDLREPLRAIRNFSSLVVEREYEHLGESSRDMLNRVVRGAERLDQLLSDVLTLSRAQRAEPAAGTVSSDQIVKEVLGDLQESIERCEARVQIAGALPELKVDAFWLRQAVHNLVANALKFTRQGEAPRLKIMPYVYAPADDDEGAAAGVDRPMSGLVFEDRGPGVESHQRERVFGLFQRAVARDVPGTGAGLAIVAQVAERYHGRVWVEDAEGGGARFILAFY